MASFSLITDAHRDLYQREGYFIAERVSPQRLQYDRPHAGGYVTQYSPEPIYKPGTHEPMHLDVPFLKDGANVYRPQRQAVVV